MLYNIYSESLPITFYYSQVVASDQGCDKKER